MTLFSIKRPLIRPLGGWSILWRFMLYGPFYGIIMACAVITLIDPHLGSMMLAFPFGYLLGIIPAMIAGITLILMRRYKKSVDAQYLVTSLVGFIVSGNLFLIHIGLVGWLSALWCTYGIFETEKHQAERFRPHLYLLVILICWGIGALVKTVF